jgi:hypothetical protein
MERDAKAGKSRPKGVWIEYLLRLVSIRAACTEYQFRWMDVGLRIGGGASKSSSLCQQTVASLKADLCEFRHSFA